MAKPGSHVLMAVTRLHTAPTIQYKAVQLLGFHLTMKFHLPSQTCCLMKLLFAKLCEVTFAPRFAILVGTDAHTPRLGTCQTITPE